MFNKQANIILVEIESSNVFIFNFTGGWITTSNITAVVEPNKRSLVVICHGLNMQLTENVVSTTNVNILCKS